MILASLNSHVPAEVKADQHVLMAGLMGCSHGKRALKYHSSKLHPPLQHAVL